MVTPTDKSGDILPSYLRGMLFGMGAGMVSGANLDHNVSNLSALAFVVIGALWSAWSVLRRR